MKKFVMTALLISILVFSLGCENSKTEVEDANKGTVVVGYSEDDSEDIFGDLSEEEIKDIIEKLQIKYQKMTSIQLIKRTQ